MDQPKKMAEMIHKIISGELPPPPVASLIGFQICKYQPGVATVEMKAGQTHYNPMSTVHGGILCDLADAAMGIAYAGLLEEGESFTTLEFRINFLKVVRETYLTAVGRVVKRGRTVGYVECDITDEANDLVARASSTCMTLRGEQARGR